MRKNKKNKYDSILPRVGLNPVVLPDKGPNSWSSFNSMNTPSSDFGGMMEEFERLDFDEVVKLDLEYIDNWSLTGDIKILFKTVYSVLKRDGAE